MQGARPLTYPEGHPEAGRPIVDWEGKPVGDSGIVISNRGESISGIAADGRSVIIINEVSPEHAARLQQKITALGGDPSRFTYSQLDELVRYAQTDLGLLDIYGSDDTYVRGRMAPIDAREVGGRPSGMHAKSADAVRGIVVEGAVEFQGTSRAAGGIQHFENGALIVQDGAGEIRAIDLGIAERTYVGVDGRAIDTMRPSTLAREVVRAGNWEPSKTVDDKLFAPPDWMHVIREGEDPSRVTNALAAAGIRFNENPHRIEVYNEDAGRLREVVGADAPRRQPMLDETSPNAVAAHRNNLLRPLSEVDRTAIRAAAEAGGDLSSKLGRLLSRAGGKVPLAGVAITAGVLYFTWDSAAQAHERGELTDAQMEAVDAAYAAVSGSSAFVIGGFAGEEAAEAALIAAGVPEQYRFGTTRTALGDVWNALSSNAERQAQIEAVPQEAVNQMLRQTLPESYALNDQPALRSFVEARAQILREAEEGITTSHIGNAKLGDIVTQTRFPTPEETQHKLEQAARVLLVDGGRPDALYVETGWEAKLETARQQGAIPAFQGDAVNFANL